MFKLLCIALGGALGALLRYAVARAAAGLPSGSLPWGTLAANLLGCLAIGFLWASAERAEVSPAFSAFVFVGVLGAFTTFSTYSLESVQLLRSGAVLRGLGYLVVSNVGGLGLVALGMALARLGEPPL